METLKPKRRKHRAAIRPEELLVAIDFETDPFLYGRIPAPFAAGCAWYEKDVPHYVEFWGPNCAQQLAEHLINLSGHRIIYAHNGGKFDFLFLREWITNTDEDGVRMIGARMVECRIGAHKLRDSFAILPVALGSMGDKIEIDYSHMEEDVREDHRAEILTYLKRDCTELLAKVRAFAMKFSGERNRAVPLTIGSAAEKALRATLDRFDCPRMTPEQDEVFRRFYYGGRVQCFETGAIYSPLKSFDVNSMYPGVMRNYVHPNGRMITLEAGGLRAVERYLKRDGSLGPKWAGKSRVYFIRFKGWARHLPLKTDDGTVYEGEGEYFACSHEVEMAFEAGCIRIDEVLECHVSSAGISFAEFVDKYYSERLEAKARGDENETLFLKLVLNSAYGRFAINPTRFRDTAITHERIAPDGDGWKLNNRIQHEDGTFTYVWRRVPDIEDVEKQFKNVAVAASITSAARAELARGIMQAKRVVYCDTDSITCEDFTGNVDPKTVGAWKFEGTYSEFHIAGKKLYAGKVVDSGKWKSACKGARLTPEEIVQVAAGAVVTYKRDAPTFSWLREPTFVVREITATA